MKISLKWLKDYVDLPKDLTADEFATKLTLSTVEVEEVIDLAKDLENVVVGKVIKLEAHPDADKLKLAQVDTGDEQLTIVCGGTNLKENMLTAVAKVGAKVRWHGEGEPVILEPAKIRGQESRGMICASNEIGLADLYPSKSEGEIVDLTADNFTVGQPLAKALGLDDLVIDIDNKSLTNRPDLWGHYGMAREASVIFDKKLKDYKTEKIKEDNDDNLQVKIENKAMCRRYLGVVIDNVKVAPSPEWLVKKMQAIGLRSINNIVDITNYILFDLGQPLHAFDANLINNNKIIVRPAKRKEKITTLDDEEYLLSEEDLVIADEKKAVALAGIMGGQNSQIQPQTTKIIIESANFDAYTIRKTSEKLGLRTEASMRYEKSLDPEMAKIAIERAVELVLEMCPQARVSSKLVDEYPNKFSEIEIETSIDFIQKRIGEQINDKQIEKTLKNLGFEVKGRADKLKIKVPSWRATKDVSIPEDLVEEVSRIYGYDNLEPQMPRVAIDLPLTNRLRDLEREIKNLLVYSATATETLNYSFVSSEQLAKLKLSSSENIKLKNPVSQEQNLLRMSLLPNLLENVVKNYRIEKNLNLFECGQVFINEPGEFSARPESGQFLPSQPLMLAGVISREIEDSEDLFYQAKSTVEMILNNLQIDFQAKAAQESAGFEHPYKAWRALINDVVVASAGEIHPQVLSDLGIEQKVVYWQINLSELLDFYERKYLYQKVSKYPAVELDVSIVLDEKILWRDIVNVVVGTEPSLIKQVELFDVYKNDKIGIGNKSLAFHVKYQSAEKTLEMKEVQKLHEKVIANLEKSLKAKIRK